MVAELDYFLEKVRQRHGRVDPCFMTGKGCVYTDQIDEALRTRKKNEQVKGFMIMPFRPRLQVFFGNCLRPFFESNYDTIRGEKGPQAGQLPGIVLETAERRRPPRHHRLRGHLQAHPGSGLRGRGHLRAQRQRLL